jgi:putative mRNA 3-end processing factor
MTAMPAQKTPLLLATDKGLECAAGNFVIDPYRKTRTAVLTHAHADHARPVAETYYAASSSVPLLQRRLGRHFDIRGVEFGQPLQLGDTTVSFHPAGHVLGSAQIRVERNRWTARSVADKPAIKDSAGLVPASDVWVFTGDFKRDADPTCEPFELVPCDTFITEATFALPVYKWQPGAEVAEEIFQWWQAMRRAERPAILFCYALGKAQRVLAELMPFTDKTVYLHGAVDPLTKIYRNSGVAMLPTQPVDLRDRKKSYEGELIIAPPGASGSTWMRRFPNAGTGFCSGWMRVRGNRRRRGYDRGFVLSDHADWNGLIDTIEQTGAKQVLTTHGQASALIRLLIEKGIDARELVTRYDATGEETVDDASVTTDTDDAGGERTGV